MKLSDTALIILNAAAQRADRLVAHRKASAPVAELTCCRSMVTKGALAHVLYHFGDGEGLVTTQSEIGETMAFWITDDGLRAIGIEPTVALAPPVAKAAPTPPHSPTRAAKPLSVAKAAPTAKAAHAAPTPAPRANLRALAQAVVTAYDGDDDSTAYQTTLTSAMDALRAALATPEHKTREGGMTKHQTTLVNLCLRPQGATAKEMTDATGWPSIAARSTMTKIADRFGYTLSEKPKADGRALTFYLGTKLSKAA